MNYLTKSLYTTGAQCRKMLWLKMFKPEVFDAGVMNPLALENGKRVGEYALKLWGEYRMVPFGDTDAMAEETQRLLDDGVENIAEATFVYRELLCRVDMLVNKGNHCVELYEIKSSTKVKDVYLEDIGFQYYILTKLGYKVQRACLVYVNNGYVRHGEIDIKRLFHVDNVLPVIGRMQPGIGQNIQELTAVREASEEPVVALGTQCFSPYPCGMFGYCAGDLPRPCVFDVAGMQLRKKVELYEKGIVSFEELEKAKGVPPRFLRQIRHEVHGMETSVDMKALKKFMDSLSYPLYFLDFESFQPPIPLYENTKAFEQIVFQYSLHYIETKGGEVKHKEYLAYPGGDPRHGLGEQLCRDIPLDACTLAYNMSFEKGRIKSLAGTYPELSGHLMNIHDHIIDLMNPFRQGAYYNRRMEGSYSIKYVLPALFPDDPELNYGNLEGVHNGLEASAAFAAMEAMKPDELEATREQLLKYCGLDTYAMVKIFLKLEGLVGMESGK